MTKPDPKFELVPQADAATEKQLAAHKKNIGVYASGVQKSSAQFFGYAFLAGHEMAQAKQIVEHGNKPGSKGFENWLKENFPALSYRTAARWLEFAELFSARLAEKTATVAEIGFKPLHLKKSFSKKEQQAILELVPEVMDGAGMIEFMQDCKLLREPKEDGGVRLDAAKLEAWLKEHHPELAGKSFDELPKKIQNAALRALRKPRTVTAEDQKEAADFVVEQRADSIRAWAGDEENLKLCSRAKLKELEDARLALGRTIEKIRQIKQ